MGRGTIIGLIVGFGMLILGFILEGGNIMALFLLSPAMIVFGGTLGAVMVSFSLSDVAKIPKSLRDACSTPKMTLMDSLNSILDIAAHVRKDGILSVEKIVSDTEASKDFDPLLKQGANLLLLGLDRPALREILDSELYVFEQVKNREISLFEAAGGYSPTMGILGTVMGLIQVLSNMSEADELARHIAVAFIATLYGVAFANLIYLPVANKLKLRLSALRIEKELIIDGLLAINELESPTVIREKLMPYLGIREKAGKKEGVAEQPADRGGA
jgi:chemotaxis protein MotA